MTRPAILSNPQFAEAFWGRTNQTSGLGPNGDCWLWTGSLVGGYGTTRCDGKTQKAHRVAWQLTSGKIPEDLHVLHHCDVRNCVNPCHLFLGTNYDNVLDKLAKGRHRRGADAAQFCKPKRGSDNYNSRFRDEQIIEMRRSYAAGKSFEEIALEHGTKRNVVNMIVHGVRWAHLGFALPNTRRTAKQFTAEIRDLASQGLRQTEIARRLNLSDAAISRFMSEQLKVTNA